jgi:hypothetical protein
MSALELIHALLAVIKNQGNIEILVYDPHDGELHAIMQGNILRSGFELAIMREVIK